MRHACSQMIHKWKLHTQYGTLNTITKFIKPGLSLKRTKTTPNSEFHIQQNGTNTTQRETQRERKENDEFVRTSEMRAWFMNLIEALVKVASILF